MGSDDNDDNMMNEGDFREMMAMAAAAQKQLTPPAHVVNPWLIVRGIIQIFILSYLYGDTFCTKMAGRSWRSKVEVPPDSAHRPQERSCYHKRSTIFLTMCRLFFPAGRVPISGPQHIR